MQSWRVFPCITFYTIPIFPHFHILSYTCVFLRVYVKKPSSTAIFNVHVTPPHPIQQLIDIRVLIRSSHDSLKHSHAHVSTHLQTELETNCLRMDKSYLSPISLLVALFEYLRRESSTNIQECLLFWWMLPPEVLWLLPFWKIVTKVGDLKQ